MTPALSLYLLAAARAEPFMSRRRQDQPAPGARPPGEVVWIHTAAGQPPHCATTLASRIADERPGTGFVLSSDEPAVPGGDYERLTRPADYPRAVDAFLSTWKPDAGVWIGGPVWPVLAAKARQAGIPMLLVNATNDLAAGHRAVPARELLGLFDGIAACSRADGQALERVARRPVDVVGSLQRSPRPLDHDEDEHLRLSSALSARPLWYAVGATAAELEALREAHAIGQGASHRLLLIVQPADADATAAALERYGARRSTHGVPPAGAAAFVADLPDEEGLWYRLASVTFVGGTLGGPAATADPFAPAALGSAILHGPKIAPFTSHFRALGAARATRLVTEAERLGEAVGDLLAPDRAAALAHQAWTVVSEGAEATDHVVEEVGRLLDRAS